MVFSNDYTELMPDIRFSRRALRYQKRLPRDVAERVEVAIERLAAGDRADVQALAGEPGYFRLRVGGLRVIFRTDGDTLVVERIRRRGDAY